MSTMRCPMGAIVDQDGNVQDEKNRCIGVGTVTRKDEKTLVIDCPVHKADPAFLGGVEMSSTVWSKQAGV